MVNIKVEGTKATIHAISMFDMELKRDIISLVRTTAQTVQRTGRANAPVAKTPVSKGKPGDLRSSIRPRYFDGGLSATVVPRRPRGSHRHLVEYGTGSRRTKSGANRGKMPAMPFMGPAEQASDAEYNSKLKGLVDRDKTI